ncbi:MAG TPA: hypothetical protein VJK02_04050 [Anaerolineales bacterium]|nr:hypothetical protein [Anaerolineales bacterium]
MSEPLENKEAAPGLGAASENSIYEQAYVRMVCANPGSALCGAVMVTVVVIVPVRGWITGVLGSTAD